MIICCLGFQDIWPTCIKHKCDWMCCTLALVCFTNLFGLQSFWYIHVNPNCHMYIYRIIHYLNMSVKMSCHCLCIAFFIKGARRWSQIVWESCLVATRLPIQRPTASDTLGWCRIYTRPWFYYNPSMVLAWKCWILMDIDIFCDGPPPKMHCCPGKTLCRHMVHSMATHCTIF